MSVVVIVEGIVELLRRGAKGCVNAESSEAQQYSQHGNGNRQGW